MKNWIEDFDEDGNGVNGRYECKDHDVENCPICTDIFIEKPISGIAGKRTQLDELLENMIKGNRNAKHK
jgi:hypothetical protein